MKKELRNWTEKYLGSTCSFIAYLVRDETAEWVEITWKGSSEVAEWTHFKTLSTQQWVEYYGDIAIVNPHGKCLCGGTNLRTNSDLSEFDCASCANNNVEVKSFSISIGYFDEYNFVEVSNHKCNASCEVLQLTGGLKIL